MPRRNLILLLVIAAASIICHQRVPKSRYGRILANSYSEIERQALEPVDQQKLFEGAMRGMFEQLDEYSAFVSPSEMMRFQEAVDQEFGGIGIEVVFDSQVGLITVARPLVGTPGQRAGIRAGDRILSIDGQSTQGLSMDDAVGRMRGEPGTAVVLSILHQGDDESVEIEVVRAVIQVNTVLGDTHNPDGTWSFFLEGYDGIGYVRINTFAENTADELHEALELMRPEMKGLILDLRDDPGGWLISAVDVCRLFLDSGQEIVTTRRRDESIRDRFVAEADGPFCDVPIVVLVNRYSASASEIVAACLQDHDRAVIVGERSFGKGTVQDVIELESGVGELKLTTASYWRPSGKNIHRVEGAAEDSDWGVRPNDGCKVIVEGDELARLRIWRSLRDSSDLPPGLNGGDVDLSLETDRQLLKAIECIERKINEGQ